MRHNPARKNSICAAQKTVPATRERTDMFDKRLLALIPEAKRLIIKTVLFRWFALLANIVAFLCLGTFLQGLLVEAGVLSAGAPSADVLPDQAAAPLGDLATSPLVLIAVFVLVIAIRTLCTNAAQKYSTKTSGMAKQTIRQMVYDKLLALGPSYTESISSSQAVQIGVEGVEQLEVYFGSYIPQFFYALVAPLTLFVYLAPMSPLAAIVLLVCVPLIPGSIMAFQKVAKRFMKAYWGSYMDLGATFLENVSGLTTLKLFNADERQHRVMNDQAEGFRRATMNVLRLQLNSITIMDILAYGGAGIGAIIVLYQFLGGSISFAAAFAIVFLSSEFFLPMRSLGSLFHTAMNGMSAADKMFELLAVQEPEPGKVELSKGPLDVEARKVSYTYDGERLVLDNVDFQAKAGQFVGLVGESGSGKSTLAGILTGRNRARAGEVLVGGVPLANITRSSLAKTISVVGYNSLLFKGTLRENLEMASTCVTDTEMRSALETARAWEFCVSKGGLDMPISEGASNLSGGQRQRIAIARTLLHDAPIMIFDEASSSIDVESEQAVLNAIYGLVDKGKTVIMITHRLSCVRNANQIFVMEGGKCVECGTHGELMSNQGAYQRLVTQQDALEQFAQKERDVSRVDVVAEAAPINNPSTINTANTPSEGTPSDGTPSDGTPTANTPSSSTWSPDIQNPDAPDAPNNHKTSGLRIMARMIGLVRPLAGYLLLAIALGAAGFVAAMLISVLGAWGLTQAACGAHVDAFAVAVAIVVCAILRGPLRYGEQICNHFIAFKLLALIRDRVFAALRRLAPAKLEGRNAGDLVSLMTSDIELLEVFYAHTISPVAIAIVMAIGILVALVQVSLAHALLALLVYAILCFVVPKLISRSCNNLGREVRDTMGALNGFVLESLRGITEAVQFGQEDTRRAQLAKRTEALQGNNAELKRRGAHGSALIDGVVLAADLIAALLGWALVLGGTIGADQAILAQAIIMSGFGPFIAVANLGATLQQTLASGARVLELLDEKPETLDVVDGENLSGFQSMKVASVTFGYAQTEAPTEAPTEVPTEAPTETPTEDPTEVPIETPIIKDFSLLVMPGEIVQISGKSGCGKSTLCKLLMRIWDPATGVISMNGTPLGRITTESLRRSQSYMSQTTHLYQGTIRENLLIARQNATDEELAAACRDADIDGLLSSLPKGLDTPLGELGDSLSGGERQRLGLARIFLHDAPFMILDEPTSNLDSLSEAAVLRALSQQRGDRTMILVSHRASTSSLATRVISLE
jgi:ATP-binding cassette, subfamily B, bacterial